MPNRIRPGQLYLARLTKNELVIRIEEVLPQGGWIARVLSHGRKVRIKEESQIIRACDENGIEWVADATVPNRRSTALPPEPQANTAILPKEPLVQNACATVAIPIIPPMVYPTAPCTLLDATAIDERIETTLRSSDDKTDKHSSDVFELVCHDSVCLFVGDRFSFFFAHVFVLS